MALFTCPACAAQVAERATSCPNCGRPIELRRPTEEAPIRHLGGKLQAIGTIMAASGIIATTTGAWWGPALLFPAVVIFILGRFW